MKVIKENGVYYIHNLFYDDLSDFPVKYVLDSNIVAEIELFYYNTSKLSDERKDKVISIINKIRGQKFDESYALCELCVDYKDGTIIRERYSYLKKAMKSCLKMSSNKLERYGKYGKQTIERPQAIRNEFGTMSVVIKNSLPLLMYSYSTLIKFFLELGKTENKNKIDILKKIYEFQADELGLIALYEITCIMYYLFNNEEEFRQAQSLMKVNKKKINILEKVWNVSWDMSFLRYINDLSSRQMSAENVGKYYNYVLITSDKALGEISQLFQQNTFCDFDGKIVSSFSIEYTKLRSKHVQQLENLHKEYCSYDKVCERANKIYAENPQEQMGRILNLIDELVKEIE